MTKHTKNGAKVLADQKLREEYNEKINHVLPIFKNLEPTSNHVTIKLFQYTQQSVTKSGIINPKQVEQYSDSGKIGAKLDNVTYKPVGLVVSISKPSLKYLEEQGISLSPGDVVWLDPKSVGQNTVLLTDRESIKPEYDGYLKIHPSQIEFKDTTQHYELVYGE